MINKTLMGFSFILYHSTACGSAVYVDDLPMQGKKEMIAVLLHSERSNAKLLDIDFSDALKVEGVIGHISAQDITDEQNIWGVVIPDEPIFASGEVIHHGQVIAAIICSSLEVGEKARKLVKITYGDANINNPDAVYGLGNVLAKAGIEQLVSMPNFGGTQQLKRHLDDDDGITAKGEFTVEGTVAIGGQQHHYLEPHNVLVIPIGEKDEYTCYVGNQEPDCVQGRLARALNIPKHKITVKTKRVGGGFGGKERLALT